MCETRACHLGAGQVQFFQIGETCQAFQVIVGYLLAQRPA